MEQTIKVYSKPNCMQCNFTKNFIIDNDIEAEFIDVTKDEQALAEMKALGYNTMPVVFVNENTHWFGFRPDELKKLCV
ncbi:glutaredoxin-like protein NrdH [Globicatella sanguinis]|uniref:glutaredoxin-like protein NrdH n=1 Tax=Globicatella sanguinis TaxID=13076 RepID=UPI000825864B|nr:glutaredoxin-like protein NrdH [Globicatella sanguinis]